MFPFVNLAKTLAILLFFFSSGLVNASIRIATLSPALTELLFQLGQGDKVVGVSEFSDTPKEATLLPRIGALFHPSIERTLTLKPQWIFVDAFTLNPSYVQAARALALNVEIFRIDSIEALFSVSEKILSIAKDAKAETLETYRQSRNHLRKNARPFRFIVLTWSEPAIAATRKTFLSSLFEQLGGENTVPTKLYAPYVPLSREWLLQNVPDFVFVLYGTESKSLEKVAAYFPPKSLVKVLPLSLKYFARSNFSGLEGLKQIQGQVLK